jgi:indole-3-glycerol phosphate synthase
MPHRRFSQAISEGDGISVIVAVEDADAARAAEAQRAEALVVTRDPASVRDATSLPILWRAQVPVEQASAVADAYLIVFEAYEDDDDGLEDLYARALEHGLECIIDVQDEEELEEALERLDPEIFLLSSRGADRRETPLEWVLSLLPNVPAGKLAIADLPHTTRDDVDELERAGVDAVIVGGRDVSDLVGRPPLQV